MSIAKETVETAKTIGWERKVTLDRGLEETYKFLKGKILYAN